MRQTYYKDLLKLGLPIMIGQLGIIVLSFADTMMVGRCGTAELAAASFVNNMFNLVIVFSTGFSYGLTPVVGNHYGRGECSSVGRMLKNGLAVNAVAALGLMMLMSVLYFNIHRLGQPAELLPLMRPYYIVLLISLLPVLLFNAFKQFADGITDTVTPMFVLLGGNVLNIFLNWVLIYGKLGAPAMGLLGAGVATLTARVAMLLCFALVFFKAKRYRPYVQGFHESRINRQDFVLLNKMGMPVGLQMGMETASFSLASLLMGWLGATELAAFQVMCITGSLCFLVYYGIGAAASIRISHHYGRGEWENIRITATAAFHIIMLVAAILSIAIALSQNHLAMLFTTDKSIQTMFAALLIPMLAYQVSDGIQINYANALRGIEVTKPLGLPVAESSMFEVSACIPK